MSKYKYYFKKPKGQITKDILLWVAASGIITITLVAPNIPANFLRVFPLRDKHKKKSTYVAFYRLLQDGSLEIQKKNNQIYISLTEEGRKKAGWLQINNLNIQKQKKWDKKWRIVMFDISQDNRFKREAFRGFLKHLQFYPFQKSVWVCPYACKDEIDLLRDFFNFSPKELAFITATHIDNDHTLKKHFRL